jgi:hypothetical protein
VRLYDRLGKDLTQRFPLIVKAMAYLPSCTIDGEAVACDDSGVPSFDVLRRRQGDHRAFLYAFDLIELTGADRRREPLEHRKFDLSQLLADASPWLVLNNWIDGDKFDGTTVFEHVCSLGLEGIVSKRKDSRQIWCWDDPATYWRCVCRCLREMTMNFNEFAQQNGASILHLDENLILQKEIREETIFWGSVYGSEFVEMPEKAFTSESAYRTWCLKTTGMMPGKRTPTKFDKYIRPPIEKATIREILPGTEYGVEVEEAIEDALATRIRLD